MTAERETMIDALDMAQLVGRAAEGDGWAWERLVDHYARLIWAVTGDFKLGESDAADVTQMTGLRLFEQLLEMVTAGPPASCTEISGQPGLPVGSIGPTRQRRLAKLLQAPEAPQPPQGSAWSRPRAPQLPHRIRTAAPVTLPVGRLVPPSSWQSRLFLRPGLGWSGRGSPHRSGES